MTAPDGTHPPFINALYIDHPLTHYATQFSRPNDPDRQLTTPKTLAPPSPIL